MRLSIKTKQVAGVTVIVGLAVIVLSRLVPGLARARAASRKPGARDGSVQDDLSARVRRAPRSGRSGTVARRPRTAAAERSGAAIDSRIGRVSSRTCCTRRSSTSTGRDHRARRSDADRPAARTRRRPRRPRRYAGLDRAARGRSTRKGGKTFEIRQPLVLVDANLAGTTDFGSIRIGVSTLLIRSDLEQTLTASLLTAIARAHRRQPRRDAARADRRCVRFT